MDLADLARMVLALAVTLGLIGFAAVAARRFAPGAILRLKPAADRRLQVIESLVLDPARRLVLVRIDREERLVLLGEGRVMPMAGGSPPVAKAKARSSKSRGKTAAATPAAKRTAVTAPRKGARARG